MYGGGDTMDREYWCSSTVGYTIRSPRGLSSEHRQTSTVQSGSRKGFDYKKRGFGWRWCSERKYVLLLACVMYDGIVLVWRELCELSEAN